MFRSPGSQLSYDSFRSRSLRGSLHRHACTHASPQTHTPLALVVVIMIIIIIVRTATIKSILCFHRTREKLSIYRFNSRIAQTITWLLYPIDTFILTKHLTWYSMFREPLPVVKKCKLLNANCKSILVILQSIIWNFV